MTEITRAKPETLEVTYPGPAVDGEALAFAEKAEPGTHAGYFVRLETGVIVGDQHMPRAAAEVLLANGTVKRTNPPPKAKTEKPAEKTGDPAPAAAPKG